MQAEKCKKNRWKKHTVVDRFFYNIVGKEKWDFENFVYFRSINIEYSKV
jgi:hypothetical protein